MPALEMVTVCCSITWLGLGVGVGVGAGVGLGFGLEVGVGLGLGVGVGSGLVLLHHLVDGDAVGVGHLVELVDDADAAVGEHHRTRLVSG